MNNQDRLLSDEELRAEYLRMFRGGLEPLAKALGSQEEHFDELVKALAKGASVIANTQKRLYAESERHDWVIKGAETVIEDLSDWIEDGNPTVNDIQHRISTITGSIELKKLDAEQRARIK